MVLNTRMIPAVVLVATWCLLCAPILQASPVANPPYTLSVFATSANGYSQPDSIVQWKEHIFVGFQTT